MRLPEPSDILHDKYRVEEVIGRGGFAVVYRATDVTIGRAVALKVLTPDEAGYDDNVVRRFAREAKALAALSDAHTIRLFDYGRTDSGLMFMAFELLEGVDLQVMIAEATLDEATATELLRQLLHSLREAHHAGILHRDIKPSNIRVFHHLDALKLKLMDFGIARPIATSAPAITQEGRAVGTPRYMSPEQVMGLELTPASDLFSVGLVVLEMLTGDPRAPLDDVYHGPGLQIPASPRLTRVLERLVQRDDRDRYQSADEVLAALDRTEDVPASTSQERPRTVASSATLIEPAPLRWQRIVLVALVILFAGMMAILLQSRGSRPAPPAQRSLGKLLASATPIAPSTPAPTPPTQTPDAKPAPVVEVMDGCGREHDVGNQRIGDALEFGEFLVRVPDPYVSSQAHALIFVFHGSGGSPDDLIEAGGLDRVADRHGVLLLSPIHTKGWGFRGDADMPRFREMLEESALRFCVDRERVYALGHGTGGYATDALGCVPWIRGTATTSHRPEKPEVGCRGSARPHINFAPTASRHLPLDGKNQCWGLPVVSHKAYEKVLYERHACRGKAKRVRRNNATCEQRSCEVPLVSCVVDGGKNWHGMTPRSLDVLGCDGKPSKYPYPDVIWEFFSAL